MADAHETQQAEIVAREMRDFRRAHEQRRREVPRAIVTGTLTGLAAVAFGELLTAGEAARMRLVAGIAGAGGLATSVVVSAAAAALALSLVTYIAPGAATSG